MLFIGSSKSLSILRALFVSSRWMKFFSNSSTSVASDMKLCVSQFDSSTSFFPRLSSSTTTILFSLGVCKALSFESLWWFLRTTSRLCFMEASFLVMENLMHNWRKKAIMFSFLSAGGSRTLSLSYMDFHFGCRNLYILGMPGAPLLSSLIEWSIRKRFSHFWWNSEVPKQESTNYMFVFNRKHFHIERSLDSHFLIAHGLNFSPTIIARMTTTTKMCGFRDKKISSLTDWFS